MSMANLDKMDAAINRLDIEVKHVGENVLHLRDDIAFLRNEISAMRNEVSGRLNDLQSQVVSKRRWNMQTVYGVVVVLIALSSLTISTLLATHIIR